MTIRRGDVFRHVLCRRRRLGRPLERDPAAVLKDLRNEFLSPAQGAADYGVVIDAAAWTSMRPPPGAVAGGYRHAPRLDGGAQGPVARPAAPAARGGAAAMARRPTASASTSAARSPTSSLLGRTAPSTRGRSPPASTTTRAPSSRAWDAAPRPASSRPSARGDPPRHDGRLQRHPRAQGRQDRPDDHQGLPRRAGDPHAAHAPPLRHRLGEAAAAGRALSAADGRRAHRCRGPGRARARPATPSAAVDALLARGRGGDRCLPHQLLRQSGARATIKEIAARNGPGSAALASPPRSCRRSRNTSAPRPRSSTPTSCRSCAHYLRAPDARPRRGLGIRRRCCSCSPMAG